MLFINLMKLVEARCKDLHLDEGKESQNIKLKEWTDSRSKCQWRFNYANTFVWSSQLFSLGFSYKILSDLPQTYSFKLGFGLPQTYSFKLSFVILVHKFVKHEV